MKTVFFQINNFLESVLRIRIIKIRIPKKINEDGQKRLFVEFIGVPGVGKTTIFQELIKVKYRNTQEWCGYRDFLNFFKDKASIHPFKPFFGLLIEEKHKRIKESDFGYDDKIFFMSFFYQKLNEAIALHMKNPGLTVLVDDGLLQNFGDCILELQHTHREEIEELLRDRILIYFFNEPKVIAKRVIKRKNKQNSIIPQHKSKSLAELKDFIKREISDKEMFLKLAAELQLPVLKINTSDGFGENCEKIHAFIRRHKEKIIQH